MVLSPYDMCVANKVAKGGNQLMVLWQVDDLKILCPNKFKVTKDHMLSPKDIWKEDVGTLRRQR